MPFRPRHLANSSWALSKLCISHCPLSQSISSASRSMIREFASQELSNLAWSFAQRLLADVPLLSATSAAAIPTRKQFEV